MYTEVLLTICDVLLVPDTWRHLKTNYCIDRVFNVFLNKI